jgi:uncharacterized protein (DUF608 family)
MKVYANTINIQTYANKKEYNLYIPFYYFKNKEINQEGIDNILSIAKKLLVEYTVKCKIVCIIITKELQEPSFPVVHPKSNIEKNFKFTPLKIINIEN